MLRGVLCNKRLIVERLEQGWTIILTPLQNGVIWSWLRSSEHHETNNLHKY
jgi:hypothetical protein